MLDISKINLENFTYKTQVSSTNDFIKDLAKQGAPQFACCFAEEQTKGRGRFDRPWQTYPYNSLAFSFLLHEFEEVMPLVLCCSLHTVLADKYNADIAIKWPNDIYFSGKKLSGILVESYLLSNGKRAYVVGIGLNVFAVQDKLDMVGFLEDATKTKISREELFVDIFNQIKNDLALLKLGGFKQFQDYFMQHCLYLNQTITVNANNKQQTGIFSGIKSNGYLILKQKEVILDISAGEIVQKK